MGRKAMATPRQIVPLVTPEALASLDSAAVNITYHGGPVLSGVEVVTIFWGADWSNAPDSTLAQQVNGFFDEIVTSSLMDLLAEYSTSATRIGHGSRKASFTITASEPGNAQPGGRIVSDDQIQTTLQGWISNGTVSATTANTLYFIYLPPNVVSTFKGVQSCDVFCGYHNVVGGNIYYAVVPYLTCSGCTVGTTFETLTEVSSHELSEAITDPALNGWFDGKQGEIGDVCAGQVSQLDGYTVQLEWSQQQSACVLTPPWVDKDLTAIAIGSPPGAVETPIAFVTQFSGEPATARVIYRAADSHLHELSYKERSSS
jgi:hypothetical protein